MALKKNTFNEEEIAIFDEAVIYKRGEYWQFRMWLANEHKYIRLSLKTTNQTTAIDKAKATYHQMYANSISGKTYFSLTAKQGVEMYVASRQKDVKAELIVKGRLSTIKTHLEHWLDFIKRDTKLKELARTDCEDYFHTRTKTNKKIPASQTTIANEQSTINAMMRYLFKHNETYIDGFEFKKLRRLDKNDDSVRRSTFTLDEVCAVESAILIYAAEAEKDLTDKAKLNRYICCYYFLFAMLSGLRTGEQRQLTWGDISWDEHKNEENEISLINIQVKAETSKTRNSREFMIKDKGYLEDYRSKIWDKHFANGIAKSYIFSADGKTSISKRSISHHFNKILELAEIDTNKRDLVPYSFRHYFITHKVLSGLSYGEIADMCGTSAAHAEKTYYHISKAMKLTNALADYKVEKNGTIVRIKSI